MRIPAYQKHSETSREAAEKLETGDTLRAAVYEDIEFWKKHGRIGDEIAENLSTPSAVIAARLRELETMGRIIKTDGKRLTRSRRSANVYVTKGFFDTNIHGRAAVKDDAKAKALRIFDQALVYDQEYSFWRESDVEDIRKALGAKD